MLIIAGIAVFVGFFVSSVQLEQDERKHVDKILDAYEDYRRSKGQGHRLNQTKPALRLLPGGKTR